MSTPTRILASGLTFTEGPRWRDGRLWFSDFYTETVYSVSLEGDLKEEVQVPGRPSGLGWLPNGDLLVVSMLQRKVMRYNGRELTVHADLGEYTSAECNDMVVDRRGNAYVGNFGFDFTCEEPKSTCLVYVRADGTTKKIADDMWFPNGAVLTPDGINLIIAESFSKQLTAFDIGADGALGNRRVWAALGDYFPDGIARDKQGGIWVAAAMSNSVIRVEQGGAITHTLPLERDCFACALSDDEEYLLLCTSHHAVAEECIENRTAGVECIALADVL